jgi:hypothetical protein
MSFAPEEIGVKQKSLASLRLCVIPFFHSHATVDVNEEVSRKGAKTQRKTEERFDRAERHQAIE